MYILYIKFYIIVVHVTLALCDEHYYIHTGNLENSLTDHMSLVYYPLVNCKETKLKLLLAFIALMQSHAAAVIDYISCIENNKRRVCT